MGWLLEVIYHIYTDKKFINRGFLYGPICPIYGISAIVIVYMLTPVNHNIFYVFIGGALTVSLIEYITGFILEKNFGTKWWDYSEEKFNIKGYICIKFSIIWGILSVVFIKFIHPEVNKLILNVSNNMSLFFYSLCLIVLSADMVLTIIHLFEFKNILEELKQIAVEIKKNLDMLKESAQDKGVIISIKNKHNILSERYNGVFLRINSGHRHFIKAYPRITSIKYEKSLQDIKNRIYNKLNKKNKHS